MRKFIFGLIILTLSVSSVWAATEYVLPEPEWGVKRDVIAAKAQGELFHEEDDWLWYTSYDAYDGGIVDTQYRFNDDNELYYWSWLMRPQMESNVGLTQMLTEYNRLKDALQLRFGAPHSNQVALTRGAEENVSFPTTPPAPMAAAIRPDTQYTYASIWYTADITIFLYLVVLEKGRCYN